MAGQSMEDALGIGAKRGRELIKKLMDWQRDNRLAVASTRIKWILDKLPDKVEAAFLIWQDGYAMQFAEVADLFERYVGVDLSSVMMKLQTGEALGLSMPDLDEVMRSSLKCPHCGVRIEQCPSCKKDLFEKEKPDIIA